MQAEHRTSTRTQRTLIAWPVISMIVLLLMLLHTSDSARFLNRYSTRYALTLAVMLAFTGAAVGVWWAGRAQRLPNVERWIPQTRWLPWAVITLSAAIMAAYWYLRPAARQPANELFQIYILGLLFAGMLWLLMQTGAAQQTLSSRWQLGLVVLAIAAPLLLTYLYIGDIPPLSLYDEPFEVSFSQSLVENRDFVNPLVPYRESANLLFSSFTFPRPIAGVWMGLFGPGFTQLRVFYLLVGLIGVPFVYATAHRLYGRLAAIASVFLAMILLLHHNYARPDIFVATAVAVGLYLYFSARDEGTPFKHYIVGLMLALAAEGHNAYGPRFMIGIGLIYLWAYIRTVRRTRRLTADVSVYYFGLGVVTYLVFYIISRTLMLSPGSFDVGSMLETMRETYTRESRGSTALFSLDRVQLNLDHFAQYVRFHPLESISVTFLTLLALWRRRSADVIIALVFIVSWVVMFFTLAHVNILIGSYYFVHAMPLIALLLAGMIAQINGDFSTEATRQTITLAGFAATLALIAIVVADTADFAHHRTRDNLAQLLPVGEQVADIVPDDVPIAGAPMYYLMMPDRRNFVANATINNTTPDEWRAGTGRIEAWSRIGVGPPQAVIVTEGHDDFDPALFAYIEANNLVKAYCFPIELFGRMTDLYLPADAVPPDGPQGCDS
ncbi:MAG: hypothetical protein D6737_16915 [Chloroflexi bacterium]|nr:MAG: hypothetical protein D6737_16915 [Chloroflexota bacterium]